MRFSFLNVAREPSGFVRMPVPPLSQAPLLDFFARNLPMKSRCHRSAKPITNSQSLMLGLLHWTAQRYQLRVVRLRPRYEL
jgi:hypothetical protein